MLMLTCQVRVLTDDGWLKGTVDGADFPDACRVILQRGFSTSDARGVIWYPPSAIMAVRPL